ncbi:ESPR-type extended signal peptide-containing protein [Acinetobacter sp. TGL-Y2]|uniref:ESPR-type extended signal peptide-containing protein n=1 Tax=Acinetobacter sp. TGL-Y2 TaxID=1407071 RepID=UPI001488BA8D|nr:ESPR-type extended signal peptide-containing protein [Acinetobacter sp. TGL-Y2]
MNKVFRVIWSKVKEQFVVVSEAASLSKNKGRTTKTKVLTPLKANAYPQTALHVLAASILISMSNLANATINIEVPNPDPIGTGFVTDKNKVVNNKAKDDTTKAGSVVIGGGNTVGIAYAGTAVGFLNESSGGSFDGKEQIGNVIYTYFTPAGTAIGYGNKALGSESHAFGGGNVASKLQSLAFGFSNNVEAAQSSAFGHENNVNAAQSSAFGHKNTVSGQHSSVLGTSNNIQGFESGAFGISNSISSVSSSYILGNLSSTVSDNTFVVGNNSKASGKNSIVIGSNAKTMADDTIAIGNGSVANIAGGVAGYNPFTKTNNGLGTSSNGSISVGDAANNATRQITNLAAGTKDTDAVNVAQLKQTGWIAKTSGTTSDIKSGDTFEFVAGKNIKLDQNGNKLTITSIDQGLDFAGNEGEFHRNLGEKTTIKGEATTAGTYSGQNLKTVADENGNIMLQMAERPEFSGLTVTGKDGKDASISFNGKDGLPGMSLVGKDGAIGVKGKDGKDGVSFQEDGRISNLTAGKDGKDAVNKDQLDALDQDLIAKGLDFAGNEGEFHRNLGEKTTIKGEATTAGTYSGQNLKTVADENGNIMLQMAERPEFSGLTVTGKDGKDASISFNGKDGLPGMSLVGKDGAIGVKGKDGKDGVSFQEDGRISNLTAGKDGKDAVNKDQLDALDQDLIAKGLDFAGNEGEFHRNLGEKTTIKGEATTAGTYSGQNLKTVADENGNIMLQMAERPEFSGLTVTGKDGKDASISFNGKDGLPGMSLVGKDGAIGVKGKDGKDGVSFQEDGRISNLTAGKDGKDAVNKDQLDALDQDLIAKGLDFAGNEGEFHRNLGEKTTIKGEATTAGTYSGQNLKTVADENGNIMLQMAERPEFSGLTVTGKDGKDASISFNGKDGLPGMSLVGKDGAIGVKGKDGKDGVSFQEDGRISNLTAGKDGKDAVNKDQLDALDQDLIAKGLDFAGNEGEFHRNLGEKTTIKGEATTAGTYSGQNLKTVADENGNIMLQMAERPEFSGLTVTGKDGKDASISFNGKDGLPGMSLVGKDGAIGVKGKDGKDGVSFQEDGRISNLTAGKDGKDAVNKDQLDALDQDLIAKGLDFAGNEGEFHRNLGEKTTIKGEATTAGTYSGQNLKTVADENGNIMLQMAERPEFSGLTVTGKDGKDASISFNGKDGLPGMSLVGKDGAIGVKGKDGKDGVSFQEDGRISNLTAGKDGKDAVNKDQLDALDQDLIAKGLDFAGNEGEFHRNLGEKTTIKGEATTAGTYSGQNLKTVADENGNIMLQMAERPEFSGLTVTGKDGKDASISFNGKDGLPGMSLVGKDGAIGVKGKDGKDGVSFQEDGRISNLTAGKDGKDAVNKDQLDALDQDLIAKGLDFAGNEGEFHRNLGEKTTIKGEATTAGTYSGQNLKTVADENGNIMLQMAERPEFSGLTVTGKDGKDASISFNGKDGLPGMSLVGKDGAIGVKGKDGKDGVSFQEDGRISNLTAGKDGKDAVNKDQLDALDQDLIAKGLDFAGNEGEFHRNLGEKTTIKGEATTAGTYSGQNLKTVADENGNIMLQMAERPEFSGLTVTGKDGKDASISFNGKDGLPGMSLVGKDGAIGVKGKDGKDGVSFQEDGRISNLTAGKDGKDAVNKDQLDALDQDLIAKGLDFAGNEGEFHRNLGEKTTIKGEATTAGTYSGQNLKTVADENGNIMLQMAERPEFSGLTVTGKDGKDASISFNGKDGLPGMSLVGKDGAIGVKGKDGKDGVSFQEDGRISNLTAGKDGKDAVNKDQLDALDQDLIAKGLDFAGNEGEFHRNLGEKTTIKGEATTAGTYSGQNLKTVADENGNIMLQMAERPEFSGLTVTGKDGKDASISFNGKDGLPGMSLVGKDGAIGVKGKDGKDGVSFQEDGRISNLTAGKDGKDAVNKDQLDALDQDLIAKGLDFAGNEGEFHRNLGEKTTIKGEATTAGTYSGQNLKTVADENGNIMLQMAERPEFSGLTVTGKDGKDASISFNGKDGLPGMSLVGKDGAIGVKGKDGKDGVSFQEDGRISNLTAGKDGKDAVNKDQLDALDQDLIAKGLDFAGNEGEFHRNLGEKTTIKGEATTAGTYSGQNLKTVADENGNIMLQMAERPEFSGLTVTGKDGKDASISFNGKDGLPGMSLVGKDGAIGVKGKDGKDGVSFQEDGRISNLTAGKDGKDAVNKDQLDALDQDLIAKGLDFAGNEGEFHRNLGEKTTIKGEATTAGTYSGQNLKTVADENGNIMLQMAERPEFSGLTVTGKDGKDASISFNGKDGLPGMSLVGKDGAIGVKGKDGKDGVSFQEDGRISNLTAGKDGKDAVNKDQLDALDQDLIAKGLDFAGNEGEFHRNLGEKTTIKGEATTAGTYSGQNLKTVADENGNIMLQMAERPEFSGLTVTGKDGKDASISFNGKDGLPGMSLVGKDGAIGVKGKDGKDGVSFQEDGRISNLTAGKDGKDAVNKDQLDALDQDLIAKGLDFAGNEGEFHRNLGEKTTIKGEATTAGTYSGQNLKTVADENGNIMLQMAERPEFSGLTVTGKDGKDASISFNGKDGLPGMSLVGKDGAIGVKGKDGKDGVSFQEDGRISNLTAGKDGKDAVNMEQLQELTNTVNSGWNLKTGGDAEKVASGDTVQFNGNGGVKVTNNGLEVQIALEDKFTVGDKIHIDGVNGSINVGKVDVNGDQGVIDGLTNTTWDSDDITSGRAATEDQLAQVSNNLSKNVDSAKTEVKNGTNIVVNKEIDSKDGHAIYVVATEKDVSFNSVTSENINVGDVHISADGINAGGNKISGIADGAVNQDSTEAINGSQLHNIGQDIADHFGGNSTIDNNGNISAPTYNVADGNYNNVGDALGAIDGRVANLSNNLEQAFRYTNNRIDKLEDNLSTGIAATAALEQAPFISGKWTYAVGAAHYNEKTAIGATLRRTADNGRWSLTGGVAGGTDGSPLVRIGVSSVIN